MANLDKDNNPTSIIISCCGDGSTVVACRSATASNSGGISCLNNKLHQQQIGGSASPSSPPPPPPQLQPPTNIQINLNEHLMHHHLNNRAESIESPGCYSYSTMSTPSRDGHLSGGCDMMSGSGGGGGIGSGVEDCDANSIDGRHSGGSCDPFLCDEIQDLGT